jgi:F-type H+-transporting ATPase subunit epsilon
MKLTVLSPKQTIFEGDVKSVFLPGDLAEFEILDYHAPIVSLLRAGNVVVDWNENIPIRRGMVKFDRNECMILVEEESQEMVDVETAVDADEVIAE